MAGFTILEAMVALIIAAMLLAVLHGLFGNELMAIGSAEGEARAILLAQSRLESLGISRPLAAGESRGRTEDGYLWREVVLPDSIGAPGQYASVTPFAVTETITWRTGAANHSLSFDTVRLGAAR